MKKHFILLPVAFSVMLLLAGCASSDNDTSDNTPVENNVPPVYTLSTDLGGTDPIEPFNRAMYDTNEFILRWGYRPLGYVWGTIFPRCVITGFNNFTDNIGFTVRMFSCLFQAKFLGSAIELGRFGLNTTVGILGFFEVAEPHFGLERQDEDFGQVFACWGIGPGCYLFLPLYGPTNVRDGVGAIFDYALDPKSYFYGGQAFTGFNRLASGYGDFDMLQRSYVDGYELLRDLSLQQRYIKVNDHKYVASAEDVNTASCEDKELYASRFSNANMVKLDGYGNGSAAQDSMRHLWFGERSETIWPYLSPWNSDFSRNGEVRSLELIDGRPDLDYKYYRAEESGEDAPLVIVLTGIGGHYSSAAATALAQMAHDCGYPAATFTNTLNAKFLMAATPDYCGGYTPQDAEELAFAVNRAIEDLIENKDIKPESVILVGYSLGALQSMFIAENYENRLSLPIKGVIAINPPVDPVYAVEKVDSMMKIAENWSAEEAQKRIADAMALYSSPAGIMAIDSIDAETAAAAVGVSFRQTLRDAIFTAQRYRGIPALKTTYEWGNRYPLYLEINQLDFNWYMNNVLLPSYRARYNNSNLALEDLKAQSTMRVIGDKLAADERIHVFHSRNDFLLSDNDSEFLENTFGERLIVFDRGGHLGALYLPVVQGYILELLREWR